ncbi:hypothetical protein NDU88_002018 [Pleurodeles waltl]|uniref:Uncharacterized protein n=1 Tax=Pleurodeles waltl TaxID=8319 RepID=A0AAV7NCT2_PLEWA|nr:hypothetical protein NDU88_002018 [Pleurodeles waltl]
MHPPELMSPQPLYDVLEETGGCNQSPSPSMVASVEGEAEEPEQRPRAGTDREAPEQGQGTFSSPSPQAPGLCPRLLRQGAPSSRKPSERLRRFLRFRSKTKKKRWIGELCTR